MRTLLRITGMPLLGLLGIISVSYVPHAAAQECSQGCVSTYGYDNSRDNVNPSETYFKATTILSVNPQHKNSPDLNGVVYAQPLYVSQVSIKVNGQPATKNVVFVATEENWVYALDGDSIDSSTPLWSTNLNNASNNETAVPDAKLPGPGPGCNNISPEVGITGTPVIDTGANLLYVVSKHYSPNGGTISQRLNVLNLYDGSPAASPLDIASNISGFTAVNENQRAGLVLITQGNTPGGPIVFVVWGSHCDSSITTNNQAAYTGWVAAFHYLGGNLQLVASFNDESGGTQGGIWMSGAAPAITMDPESQTLADLYIATGNGSWNGTTQFGESVLQLHHSTGALSVTGFYTPNAYSILTNGSGSNCTSPLQLRRPTPQAQQRAALGILTWARGA